MRASCCIRRCVCSDVAVCAKCVGKYVCLCTGARERASRCGEASPLVLNFLIAFPVCEVVWCSHQASCRCKLCFGKAHKTPRVYLSLTLSPKPSSSRETLWQLLYSKLKTVVAMICYATTTVHTTISFAKVWYTSVSVISYDHMHEKTVVTRS